MKLIFTMCHPAHYHLLKHLVNKCLQDGFKVKVLITNKDILETLIKSENWDVENYYPEGRRIDWLPTLFVLPIITLISIFRLYKIVKREKPALTFGTELTMVYVGYILGIKSLIVNEDDTKATPENYVFYPFATKVVMPDCCDIDKWDTKKIIYRGYHELAYLHPKYFKPDKKFVEKFNPLNERYFILRLAKLDASHDIGKSGIDDEIAKKIINILSKHGKVYITSERPLKSQFEKFRINIKSQDIFHALSYADLYIGDSQTMAAEAAVLGTPSVRFNDFIDKIGYLIDLEKNYGLTIGIKADDSEKLFDVINQLLNTKDLKKSWSIKRNKMLNEKIDVTQYYFKVIKNYL